LYIKRIIKLNCVLQMKSMYWNFVMN